MSALDEVLARVSDPNGPEALTDPERLGMVVAACYGNTLVERDQARGAAQVMATKFGGAMAHLEKVLGLFARGLTPGFAADQRDVDAAQAYLADHAPPPVDSSGTPEQEPTP